MIVHPKVGQLVIAWYAKRNARHWPHHGKVGRVVIVAKGPGPRNHGVDFGDGVPVAVPCGNLRAVGGTETHPGLPRVLPATPRSRLPAGTVAVPD